MPKWQLALAVGAVVTVGGVVVSTTVLPGTPAAPRTAALAYAPMTPPVVTPPDTSDRTDAQEVSRSLNRGRFCPDGFDCPPSPSPTPSATTPPPTPKSQPTRATTTTKSNNGSSGTTAHGGGAVAVPSSCAAYHGNQALACALLSQWGFGIDQMSCLIPMWNNESGWNTTARNPGSGAYGIPQSLPASKMAVYGSDYLTNPVPQIKWGLSYVKGRYGTPCGAWSFWQRNGWY